jgi:hypothetical protein
MLYHVELTNAMPYWPIGVMLLLPERTWRAVDRYWPVLEARAHTQDGRVNFWVAESWAAPNLSPVAGAPLRQLGEVVVERAVESNLRRGSPGLAANQVDLDRSGSTGHVTIA